MGEAVFWQFPVKDKVLMVKPNWECTKGWTKQKFKARTS